MCLGLGHMLIPLCVCFINYDMLKINKKSKREKYSTTIDQVSWHYIGFVQNKKIKRKENQQPRD